jgi:hypothetical protein
MTLFVSDTSGPSAVLLQMEPGSIHGWWLDTTVSASPPVTGTPGTGKTSLCHQLAASLPLQHINIGDLVKEKELHDGWDEEYQSWNLNEDKVSCSEKVRPACRKRTCL